MGTVLLLGKTSDVSDYIIDILLFELAKRRHHRSLSNSSSAFGDNVVQKRGGAIVRFAAWNSLSRFRRLIMLFLKRA
jgi:hypothetical protein